MRERSASHTKTTGVGPVPDQLASSNTRWAPGGIRLTHAAIVTAHLDDCVDFYRNVLGLEVSGVGDDPIRKGRRRATLRDGRGHDVVEIIEMPEMPHRSVPGRGGIHHLGFRLPGPEWHALRARLDALSYDYQEIEGRLFVRDTDGLVLEIERT